MFEALSDSTKQNPVLFACVVCVGCARFQHAAPERPTEPPGIASTEPSRVERFENVANVPFTTSASSSGAASGETDSSGNIFSAPARPPTENLPPPSVTPPYSTTMESGDGHWQAFGAGEGAFWRTRIHPHPRSRFVTVDVVAVDLGRFRLEWVVGSGDVGASALIGRQTPGLIEHTWVQDVVAVFNGGFQARHGRWGQLSHGETLVTPRPEGCGVALYEDGSVALGRYDECNNPGLVTYRQAPPCLVSKGEQHVLLAKGQDGIWAGKSAAEKTRRRSAVGLTEDHQTLFYLIGVEAAPIDLARALEVLGVDSGLQLDINWNWTRFFLVDGASGAPALGAALLEGMVADKGEYVRRPSKRDFFAIRRRSVSR
jgi:hypothetical protein